MISYKQYKAINEAVMPSFTLGLANPSNMGLASPFSSFAEAKKKMFGDKEAGDDETGDGEMVKPSSEKDDPDVDVDMGDDDGGCGCNSMSKKTSKKHAKKASKKKMWSDEDDAPEVEDEEGEDEDVGEDEPEEDDEMGDEEDDSGEILAGKGGMKNGPVAGGPMFSKKSKKKMCGDEDEAIEDAEEDLGQDLDGDDEEGEPEDHKEKILMSKKSSKKASKKEMKKEEAEDTWWNSVKNMIGPAPDTKYNDGWTEYQTEDGFKVENPQASPKAGEIGFAPQGKIGSFFSN